MAMVISRKYEVVGQLGQGGMGLVYKVRHTRLETISALKVLPAYLMENEDMVNRFYREARVMARLNHPNIVKVLDIERDETLNLYYFVMEYIEGVTLGKYLREKGPLPLPELLTLSRQVAEALGYAHNHTPPIIHRDIKPANIMIEERSSRVVVMDFGIAKELGDGDSTKTGMVIGTLKYASPEQLRHEPLDGSADVYSLGMVMYEMYTGKQFFGGLDEHEVLRRVLYDNKENKPPFDRPPPTAFADLLTRAIAKTRTRRYPGMRDLLQALDACRNLNPEEEETGTLILPGPAREDKKNKEAPADEDIDQRIRELQEEQQRRRVLPFQTQARAARERAAREGAAEWTAALLQQGRTSEEQGAKSLRERDFTAAQQAFEEAIQIFDRAGAEAKTAAAKHKAEQARDNMAAAKEEAEHYGAREHARTRYTRGLTLQSQADEFLEKQDFQQSAQIYSEAARFFADARELAYRETLKEEAEKARTRVVAAKAAAEEKGAAQFAESLFWEAVDQEQRANAAITHEEFTQARELFLAAAQKYERAQQQAQSERQRREAVAVQRQAAEAQGRADTARAREFASPSYQQAVIFQKQGDTHLQAQAHEKAAHAYVQARDCYQRAAQEATLEQEKQETAAVRRQLQQAQAQADQAEAKERAAAAYAEVQRLSTQGQENEKQQKYGAARDFYTQATQRFQQLAREATVLVTRERADVARQKMAAVVQDSEALQTWAKASWTKAQERAQQAELAYQKQEYGRAAELYVQATQAYVQARANAEREQLQQETHDAQQQAQSAKARAEKADAARYAADLWQKGLERQKDAEQQMQAKDLRVAIQRYWRATELLTKAAEAAQHERRKQEAAAARQRAEDVRQVAEKAGAARRFADDFAHASHLVEQAKQEEAHQNFSQAVDGYQQALQTWQRLAGDAFQEAEREKAEAFRERVAEARNGLSGLDEWFGAKYTEVQRREGEADTMWSAKRYTEAAAAYERVVQLYGEARQEAEEIRKAAEIERLRQRALDARQQAEDARTVAEQAEAKQYTAALYQRVTKTQQQAEQHLRAQHWSEASQEFLQARSLWSQAAHDAQQEKTRQAAAAIRQRLEAARTAAEEAEANTRFAQEFARAQRLTEQGQHAETQQDFAQATSLYEQALQQLLRLRREADVQAAREEADTARRQMLLAKEKASTLKQWAKPPWDAAQKHEADAERTFKGEDYEAALAEYAQASRAYAYVVEVGERERLHQEVAQAEKQAASAKKKAEEAGALRLAPTEFNQGIAAITEAGRRQQQQEFIEATRVYRRAEELFTQSEVTAQREQAKQQVATARQYAEEALSTVMQTDATRRFPQDLTQAQQLLGQGRIAEGRQDFSSARRDYGQAQQQLVKLAQVVQQQIAREQAETEQQKALQAKYEASTLAPSFAAAIWKEAQSHESEGDRAWEVQTYEQAREHYKRAAQSYGRARIEAEAEERRQRAVAASQETKERQNEADIAHALQYAEELYRKAQAVKEQAETEVTAERFEDAVVAFVHASELFTNACETAQLTRTKQMAVEAREKAVAAQTEAQTAKSEELLPGQYVEAMSLFHEAEQALMSDRFDAAREQFERVTVRWQQIRQEASVAQQKQMAESAKMRAYELREHTGSAKGRQKKQGEKAITSGDQLFQQKRYPQAQASYEEALVLLSALRPRKTDEDEPTLIEQGPQLEDRPEVPPVPVVTSSTSRQSTPLIAGAAALAVAAALGLYFSSVFQSSEPKQVVKVEPPPKVEPAPPKVEPIPPPPPARVEPEPPPPPTAKVEPEPPPPPKTVEPEPPKPELPLQPPKLTQAKPDGAGEMTIAEGKQLAFLVDAQSAQPQSLKFAWLLDGKKQIDGKKWTYQPGYDDGGDRVREVKAVISDGKNAPLEKIWTVRVQDTPRPPVITTASPKAGSVQVPAGEEQRFTVQASDPDKDDRLVYIWSLDGQEVARGESQSWQLPASISDASHAVKVEVIDKADKKVQVAWNVIPKPLAVPPRIVDVDPGDTSLTVDAGKPLDFVVTAEITGASGDTRKELSYLWSINDARPQSTDSGRFRFAETRPGTYQLSAVAVGPDGLQSAAKRWTVEVKAIAVIPLPPPPPKIESSKGTLSQQEAMNWLETTYRQAWENKNVDVLVQLGEVSAQNAAKLKGILDGYKSYTVSFKDVTVRNESNRAVVRFTRVDTIDGKTLPLPPKEITLEKGNSGRIVRR